STLFPYTTLFRSVAEKSQPWWHGSRGEGKNERIDAAVRADRSRISDPDHAIGERREERDLDGGGADDEWKLPGQSVARGVRHGNDWCVVAGSRWCAGDDASRRIDAEPRRQSRGGEGVGRNAAGDADLGRICLCDGAA